MDQTYLNMNLIFKLGKSVILAFFKYDANFHPEIATSTYLDNMIVEMSGEGD